jgi:hypothetical protein
MRSMVPKSQRGYCMGGRVNRDSFENTGHTGSSSCTGRIAPCSLRWSLITPLLPLHLSVTGCVMSESGQASCSVDAVWTHGKRISVVHGATEILNRAMMSQLRKLHRAFVPCTQINHTHRDARTRTPPQLAGLAALPQAPLLFYPQKFAWLCAIVKIVRLYMYVHSNCQPTACQQVARCTTAPPATTWPSRHPPSPSTSVFIQEKSRLPAPSASIGQPPSLASRHTRRGTRGRNRIPALSASIGQPKSHLSRCT